MHGGRYLASLTLRREDWQPRVSKNRFAGLLHMLTGYRLMYLGATITLGLGASAKTGTYLLLSYLIDNVLLRNQVGEGLILIAASFIGLSLLEGGFTFISGTLAARTAEGTARRIRNYLFDHLQRLNFTYHDRNKTGELVQRVTSDVDAVRRFYAEQAIGLGRILLLFSVNWVALLAINVKLGLLAVIIVPFLAVLSVFFFGKVQREYMRFQEQEGKMSTTLQENLSGVRVVKAFARQRYETDKFEGDNFEHYRRANKLLRLHSVYWPLTDILAGFQMLAGYMIGATMVINGELSIGSYIAFVGMITWIIEPMRGLGRIIVHASEGLVSYERIAEILREEREPLTEGLRTLGHPVQGEVAFENVGFRYESGGAVLSDITFTVKPGQTVALIGSTGSGKTSLVNLLARFYEYTSGRLTLDGVDIKTISREFLRANIGIVEQEPFLFSRTLRENIAYGVGRDVTDDEVFAAARAADVHHVALSFPDGYSTVVGEKGVTLSGGQKQRVAIARALLKNPPILILDDSTSSVDTETEANIRAALERLMKHRTTFIIAHRVQSVMDADLILVLDKGRIVQRGTHADLIRQPGFYQRIYDLQARIESELEREIAGV
ncbi:MAG: ABC transporter ATP-binding protein [Anaerolineae bacterium]|nr:ABC transporter ATP-binding protein [Anaerolineae bacterium]